MRKIEEEKDGNNLAFLDVRSRGSFAVGKRGGPAGWPLKYPKHLKIPQISSCTC